MEAITTKKDEVIQVISTPEELQRSIGKFTNKTVLKSWKEDFVDEGTGEVVTIDRNEVLFEKGVMITADIVSELLFHLQCEDIKSLEVSNQRRAAYESSYGTRIYMVKAEIGPKNKKHKFLFPAHSIPVALEILKDYIELNFIGGYRIVSVKEFQTDVILEDKLKTEAEAITETIDDDKFYQITVLVQFEDGFEYKANAVVKTTELDKAIMLLDQRIREQRKDDEEPFTTKLEEAKLLTVDHIIEDDFLAAYAAKPE